MKWLTRPLRLSTALVFLVVLAALVMPAAHWLRFVLGLPLVLLLPGRALVMAFDPRRKLGGVERLAVSIALSISLTIGCGMLLALSPLGFTEGSCILALSAITLGAESISLRRHAPDEDSEAQPIQSSIGWSPTAPVALSLGAMALIAAVVIGTGAFRPSSGELLQLWMLPEQNRNKGVEIGVAKTISPASRFRLQYYQGSVSASDTPLTLRPGASVTFKRAPLLETTQTAPPLEARLEASSGRTRPRSVSWWLK